MNTTIILTSTVTPHMNLVQNDPQERKNRYIFVAKQWLYNTNFNVVLLENSGYDFKELESEKKCFNERFEVISFNERTIKESQYVQNSGSIGYHEIFAINYAFFHSTLIKHSTFVIKITARYYIPELETYLQNYDLNNYDCLVQNDRSRCEIVGCHARRFFNIFHPIINDPHIENVYKMRTSYYTNVIVCKEFNIQTTKRGSVHGVFNTI
jgi:hypothetical protein